MAEYIRLINPISLQNPTHAHYSHLAITAPGCHYVHLAGQVGVDRYGNVPTSLEAQARIALSNVETCLAEAGATVRNLVSVTIYVVDYDAASCPIWSAFEEFLTDEVGKYCPPGTLVPVTALASPGLKIEVQCLAAVQPKVRPHTISSPVANIVDTDVVIVGAGLSGLQAATDLHNAGLSCIVLEAKDRVGGKTQSVAMQTGRGVLDVGAAWINNKTQTRMYGLYQKFGCRALVQRMQGDELLRTSEIQTTRVPYLSFPPVGARQQEIVEKIWKSLDAEADQIDLYDSTANSHINDISLGEYFRKGGAQGFSWNMWVSWIRALTGCEPDDISLVYFLDYIKSAGGLDSLLMEEPNGAQYLRNRDGNQTISIRLASELKPGSVKLSTPVTKVTQTDRGCVVETYSDTKYRCRKVLVSIPTPLYKHLTFSPPLPAQKLEITNSTHLGAYSKCILIYSEPWWRAANLNGAFCDYDGPIAFSRDVSCDEDGVFAIACFLFGEYATKWSRLTPTMRLQVVKDQLAEMVGEELSLKVKDTIQTIEKQWVAEPWSEGAPCPMVPPGGVWTRWGNQLRAPFGNIHFIGTETAYEWKGYMEGAVASGERGAAEVIADWKSNQTLHAKL